MSGQIEVLLLHRVFAFSPCTLFSREPKESPKTQAQEAFTPNAARPKTRVSVGTAVSNPQQTAPTRHGADWHAIGAAYIFWYTNAPGSPDGSLASPQRPAL